MLEWFWSGMIFKTRVQSVGLHKTRPAGLARET